MSQNNKKKPKMSNKNGSNKARVKIHPAELLKQKKNGLEVVDDIPHFIQNGWESIPTDERDRLKYVGVFFRRQTPGAFMMRLRMTCGRSNSSQFRTIARISELYGTGYVDLTTRQQVQLRGFTIENVQTIWDELEEVGLNSLQTGFDNIRGVTGCPVAGLTPNELFDASNIAQKYTEIIVGNRDFTDLPRKFNVGITGCLDNCTHAASQDIALIPALKEIDGVEHNGFNVLVGGKMGSGGFTPAKDLNAFVLQENAAHLCAEITKIFRDHGPRSVRNKSRFAFLLMEWGIDKFRQELEIRYGKLIHNAGKDMRGKNKTDHSGIYTQKQKGLNYVGIVVPVGRITTYNLLDVARIADEYGSGDIRLTQGQNLVIPNVPDEKIGNVTSEPLLQELRYDPTEISRGMVSCTGMDYCHFSLIETKERGLMSRMSAGGNLTRVVIAFIKEIALKSFMIQYFYIHGISFIMF